MYLLSCYRIIIDRTTFKRVSDRETKTFLKLRQNCSFPPFFFSFSGEAAKLVSWVWGWAGTHIHSSRGGSLGISTAWVVGGDKETASGSRVDWSGLWVIESSCDSVRGVIGLSSRDVPSELSRTIEAVGAFRGWLGVFLQPITSAWVYRQRRWRVVRGWRSKSAFSAVLPPGRCHGGQPRRRALSMKAEAALVSGAWYKSEFLFKIYYK